MRKLLSKTSGHMFSPALFGTPVIDAILCLLNNIMIVNFGKIQNKLL